MNINEYVQTCAAELRREGSFHFEGQVGRRIVAFKITPVEGGKLAGVEVDGGDWEPTYPTADFGAFVKAHATQISWVLSAAG